MQKEEYQVWASADSIQVRKERTVQGLQRATYLLTKSYINFRLKKIVTGEWTKQTLALIQRMQEFQPNDPWYLLFQAYALQRNKQRQDAQWLMDEFRQKNKGKKDPQWAFYDYLCLQKEKEPVVVDRLLDEIEEIAKRYGTHPMIFFLTLRLNGTLRTQPQVKLRVMEARIMQGQYSPLWYVEAFTVYQEQPYVYKRQGWNEKAFELVSSYGYAGIGRQKLAHLITYMLRARDIGEDAFLLELCMAVLERDVQNAVIVSYLAKYYEGPSKQMMRVYQAAQLLEIKDTAELEERLLIQTLYSTEYVDRIQEVYLAYRAHNGREFIIQAYRSYCMHEYVVHDMILPASLFLEACQLYKEGRLRGIVCRLGLLKYFSETDKPDRYQLKMADELLNEFISTNMNFAFFNRLPDSLCRKYQLYNRKVVEYHARPDSKIAIHYRMPKQQQEFTASAMSNRYDGIFTWEFLLFRDDEVEYYITEETENGTQQLGESNRITGVEYRDIRYGGRYAYINHMLYLREQGNERDLLRTMQEYEKLSILSSKMFKII